MKKSKPFLSPTKRKREDIPETEFYEEEIKTLSILKDTLDKKVVKQFSHEVFNSI